MPFGLFDRAYARFRGSGDAEIDLRTWGPDPYIEDRGSEDNWVCFLPNSTINLDGIIPKTGNVTIYRLPSKAISSRPMETRDMLLGISSDACDRIESCFLDDPNLNFLGVSLGAVLPFHLISKCGYKARRLVAVTPGGNLAKGVLESLATREVIKTARRRSPNVEREYIEALSEFNPTNHVKDISPDTAVEIHLGTHDKFVPREYSEELVDELHRRGKKVEVTRYRCCGHVRTILKFARTWQREKPLNPDVSL